MDLDAIAFDADDTLWHNEDAFAETEASFATLVEPWATAEEAHASLFSTETRNIALFGYGVKSFTLSMLETASALSGGQLDASRMDSILHLGKSMLERPAELLPDVAETLHTLRSAGHRMIVVTKGDLHHQERKAAGSGLLSFFDALEVVSEKDTSTYERVARRHGIAATALMMVGNSVRSDVLPIVELGGIGVHIPYSVTWAHEHVDQSELTAVHRNQDGARYWELDGISELPALVHRLRG